MDEDGDDDEEESKKSITKSKIEKTIFNSAVKNTIENESVVTAVNNNEITITLPDNEFNSFNQSGLLNEYSNEQSLIMLMNCINKKKEKNINKHKCIPIISNSNNNNNNKNKTINKHFKPHSRNSNHNLDTKESKFICYTNLCQKKNFQVIKEQNVRSHTKSQTQLKQSFNNKKSRNVTHVNNTNNSTSKFKTFELFTTSNNNIVNNTANKNRLIKTQNVENLINRITHQVKQNTKAHKRNNYSTDNFISNQNKLSHNTKPFQTQLLRSTNIKKNATLKDKKVIAHNNDNITNNKRKTSSKKPINTNSTQMISSNTNADDIMKKTFTFLISNNPHKINNKLSTNNTNNNAIHIQSLNININNQININNANANNVQDNLSPKINAVSLNKYKKMSQQSNKPDKPITGITINKRSRNKGGSYDINHNTGITGNSNGMIFSSCNGLDSKGLNSFMKKNAAKTTC